MTSSHLGKGGAAKAAAPPTHFIKGDGTRRTIRLMVEWWAKRYPLELENYAKEVAITRQTQKRTSGMSDGGYLMTKALMPVRLFLMGEKYFGKGFWKEGGYELWYKEFEQFRVKKPK